MTPPDIRAAAAPRPAFAPRAVVLDLDGTCISRGTFLHERTRVAVNAATRRLPVVVATGRQYTSALPWVRLLGVREPLVCYEGAQVRALPDGDGAPGALLLDEPLAAGPAQRALHLARKHGWHLHGYVDDEIVAERDRPELRLYTDVAGTGFTIVPDLEPLLANGTPKVVCVIDDLDEVRRCIRIFEASLQHTARVTRSREQYVEVVNAHVSKSAACELVCERLGITLGDAVAIGDAPNDVDLLDAAGFAVAVGSGRYPEVPEHADATCAPPTEAGVADVFEVLGLA